MRSFLVLVLVLVTVAGQELGCPSMLKAAGASDKFGGNVAHSIHSLTVEDLKYFNPFVNASNIIPTINMDLRSEVPILDHAPEAQASPFMSRPMRTLDRILSHMDNANYDVKFFSLIERVVHAFHMQHSWEQTLMRYEAFKQTKLSGEVCRCALDISHNGVMNGLRFTSLGMREPGLVYGTGSRPYYVEYQVTYHFGKALKPGASLDEKDLLLTQDDAMPELVDQTSWGKWRDLLMSMEPASYNDVALYLYCALNH